MISAVVLTKNEENNIVDCLESLSFCGEIIVIDDYSEDRTIEILKPVCRQAGQVQDDEIKIKIFQRHLGGDFAGQRNFGMEKTKGEWILFVDSDERVSEKLRKEILKQVQDDDGKYDGFYVKRKDFLFGRWLKYGETGEIKLVRLVRKNKGRWERRVHERLMELGELGELGGTLLHYPHQTVSEFLREINFYTDLNAQEFYENYHHQVQDDISIIFYPLGKFMQNYFLKLGFLDGTAGFLQAVLMSFHSFLTRGKLWEITEGCHFDEPSMTARRNPAER